MATLAFSAAGMALGGAIGGSVLGLSMATVGRAAGAAVGRRIDQQLLGAGSSSVETGRIERFRVTGASEGAAIQQVYGRMRVAGQVIWASQFLEQATTTGGGKGRPAQPRTTQYAYSVSLAVALCEGQISRVGRIWADGTEIAPESLNLRLYDGSYDQLPDPKIAAIEGAENTPAYRGTAYVVLEDLDLARFGNRIPQLSFEVMRPAQGQDDGLGQMLPGVALMPGSGEYAWATTQLHAVSEDGTQTAVNTNTPQGGSDFDVALNALQKEVPSCGSVLLPVHWFADDLRCNSCRIAPHVTPGYRDATQMPWQVSGVSRAAAETVPCVDDRPIAGGTPADTAVIEAIAGLKDRGLDVVVSPVLMMSQVADNTLPDPYSASASQPAQPWIGEMTASVAPGREGSPDRTTLAAAEIATFMGQAQIADFTVSGHQVTYSGAPDDGYRRFILHYAHLCAAAGGVTAFCIGTELSGLTRLRDASGFPMVDALRALAADVRQILGTGCKISYAADWTEYHGMQPAGTTDKIFHLDPLWADPAIDVVAVSAAVPLADWRDSAGHRDERHGAIHDLNYLRGNVAGGEHHDWHYPTPEARAAQRRVPLTDPAGEDWVWRPKDFAGWWGHAHHNRVGGMRETFPTAWQPKSKPIWFTSVGCPAIDMGANNPGHVLQGIAPDPLASNGNRDDLMQMQYLRAFLRHYADPANNPISPVYGGPMVDQEHLHVWGWDARPFPHWPGQAAVWSDGGSYARGHWVNGRVTNRSLASVVAEICTNAGVVDYDVSALFGIVRGYTLGDIGSGRSALQPLMLAYGFDAVERDGKLVFANRDGRARHVLTENQLARDPDTDRSLVQTRAAEAEIAGRVQFAHIAADGDYDAVAVETVLPDDDMHSVTRSEAPLAMTRPEGKAVVARWLQEARIGRETARFALPQSQSGIAAGDTVALPCGGHYRIDRVEEAGLRLLEATRVAPEVYHAQPMVEEVAPMAPYVGPTPTELIFLDLPLLTGDELPHAPHVASAARPWPGRIALYAAPQDAGYQLQELLTEPSTVGVTQTSLARGPVGIWDRQTGLEVTVTNGTLSSALPEALLAGANTLAIGDGAPDNWEVLQFATATPIAERQYRLSGLLRGQLGTRGLMPDAWPAGSRIVALDGVPRQISLTAAMRGTERHFRFGPATQPLDDPSFCYETHSFDGIGLRPYPVAHLRSRMVGSNLEVSWIRCSRIDGDLWSDGEVPLGETEEAYRVRIMKSEVIVREETVTQPAWVYSGADQSAEIGYGFYSIEIAQLSDRFGAGLPVRVLKYL